MSNFYDGVKIGTAAFIVGIGVMFAMYAFAAFLIMVLVGAIVPHFGGHTIGFGLALLITFLIAVIASFFNKGKK